MRVTSDFWVAAYLRLRNDTGFFTAVVRRGSPEAGAIFVKIARLDGTADLYAPLPQSLFEDGRTATSGGRLFERVALKADERTIDERLARERNFDPDLWIVESEARGGEHGLDVIDPDAG
nr:DUF1491 family protein [Methylobrevis pamukkalensis]